jgi:hypothetical protein
MNAEKHQVEKIKEFEHRQQLQQNALYAWAENLLENIRSGRLFTTRAFGVLLAVVLAVGVIYYVVRSGKSDKSRVWAEFANATNAKALKDFADQNPKSPAAKAARLQDARIVLGPEGLDRLNTKEKGQRAQAIANVEKGRDEMAKLADEFTDDLTLRVQCLRAAGEAELSLVGIPSATSPSQFRGTVEKAVEYFNKAAETAGPTTPAGEADKKKADDLLANREKIVMLGVALNNQLSIIGLPPIGPNDLKTPTAPGGKPIELPALPDMGPQVKPGAAIAGGAVTADPTKKEEAPAPKPVDKK